MIAKDTSKVEDDGDCLKQAGKIKEAIDFYQQAIELAPNNDRYYFKLGKLLQEQGQITNASIYFRQSIQLKPEYSWSHYALGDIFTQQGKLKEAVDCYKRTIELNPDFSWSYYKLGRILQEKYNLETAKVFYEKAIELEPDYDWARQFLADVLTKLEEYRLALDCYHQSIALNSDYLKTYEALGKILRNRDPDVLIKDIQKLQTNSRIEQACIKVYLGQALQNHNQHQKAIQNYEKAIEIEPYFELPYELIRKSHGSPETIDNYQRFIVLCHPRTGSNFLGSLLLSHPQIRAFGEMFSEDNELHWLYSGYKSRRIIELREENPIYFIDKLIYRQTFPSFVKAVGFKLFYFQLKNRQHVIWQYLKKLKNLKIIHLTRKNMLHTYVSHKLATISNQWKLIKEEKNSSRFSLSEPIVIDYEECLATFKLVRYWETQYGNFFDLSTQQYCNVNYEDLVGKTEQVTNKLQEFIGVDRQPLTFSTIKQGLTPMKEMVANYDQLKRKFQNSCWVEFFDE
ncbi:tetratricopeptide repeat protein [Xenococcus sp. PCC 7305]|uniref:sulfotransferase family protein n=1 Tax=Xenococcus sp. PCC 7305 TaxID=102125 RepID=UPI0002AC7E4F|nr:sulfotransferase [Xenococcus sp. PCC 7305]ELS02213.1 tetratricopeptide repeat protein [Xenococcus sp. PCC 7305]